MESGRAAARVKSLVRGFYAAESLAALREPRAATSVRRAARKFGPCPSVLQTALKPR